MSNADHTSFVLVSSHFTVSVSHSMFPRAERRIGRQDRNLASIPIQVVPTKGLKKAQHRAVDQLTHPGCNFESVT